MSDQAIAGLNDPDRFPFPPDQKAALRFADAMTEGDGHVEDSLVDELRRHFDEAQMVEIASVVGLFNYFNRFNNVFRMDVTLADPDLLVQRVERAAAEEPDPKRLCERTCDILAEGRRYLWVAVYRKEKDRMVGIAWSGPAAPRGPFRLGEEGIGRVGSTGKTWIPDDPTEAATEKTPSAATRSEIAVPIRSGTAVVGVLGARSASEAGLDDEDRALLERVAGALSPALSTSPPAGH